MRNFDIIRFFLIVLTVFIVYSCQTTHDFASYTSFGQMGAFSCETDPVGVVERNKPITISIIGGDEYNGEMSQRISGPANYANKILYTNKKTTTIEGKANKLLFDIPGKYKVTFDTLDQGQNKQGSCNFEVLIPCEEKTRRVGANILFMVDNSGSHGVSDCPNNTKIGTKYGAEIFQCLSRTAREQSILNAVESIKNFTDVSDQRSYSSIAFASFPQKNNNDYIWYDSKSDLSQFYDQLNILNKPEGMTPYHQALAQSLKFFKKTKYKDKSNVLILITDGYPTDQRPREVLALAEKLKDLDVKIYTFMVTGESSQENLRKIHQGFVSGYIDKGMFDLDAVYKYNISLYFQELLGDGGDKNLGLLRSISDGANIFYVKSSKQLKKAINNVVQSKALQCKN